MTTLYGVMDADDMDRVWTYEAQSAHEAAAAYLDDPECAGTMVRVWNLGRHPQAFVKTKSGDVMKITEPGAVFKDSSRVGW